MLSFPKLSTVKSHSIYVVVEVCRVSKTIHQMTRSLCWRCMSTSDQGQCALEVGSDAPCRKRVIVT